MQPKITSNNTDNNNNNNNNDYATISQAMWIKYLQRDFPSVIMKGIAYSHYLCQWIDTF